MAKITYWQTNGYVAEVEDDAVHDFEIAVEENNVDLFLKENDMLYQKQVHYEGCIVEVEK